MKTLLKILFAAFAIVLILVIAALFLPKKMQFVATKKIDVSPVIVFEQINDLYNWPLWMPWFNNDSSLILISGEVHKGKQATINWTNKDGGGTAIITHSVLPESVAADLSFGTRGKTICLWYIEPTLGGCSLNWTLNVSRLGLFERILLQIHKKETQAMVSEGLENISRISLALKYSRTGPIAEAKTEEIPSVVMIDSVHPSLVNDRLEYMEAYLMRFFERRNLEPTGQAYHILYPAINDTLMKIGVGIPLEERTWVWRTLQYMPIQKGRVITQVHYGKPENSVNSHHQIEQFIKENGLELNGMPWEVPLYRKDSLAKDSSTWETQVFYPVK